MRYTMELLVALHGVWIAGCAMLGAFIGMATPFIVLGWALLQVVMP